MSTSRPPQLESLPIALRIGNRSVNGTIAATEGIKFVLSLGSEPPAVPRVRLELPGLEEPWGSVQIQAVVKKRMPTDGGYAMTISIDRFTIVGDRDALASLLAAWFPNVARLDDCCREMMRGMGYELRKASLSDKKSDFHPPPIEPIQTSNEPAPVGGARSAPVSLESAPVSQNPEETAPASSPNGVGVEPENPSAPPDVTVDSPKVLSTASIRAVNSLLSGTIAVSLPVGVQSPGGPYVYGLVYRSLPDGKRIFLVAPCPNPAFGMRFELCLDVEDDGGVTQVVMPTEAAWFARHPEHQALSLFALRMATDAEEHHIEMWRQIVAFAAEGVEDEGLSPLPADELVDELAATLIEASE